MPTITGIANIMEGQRVLQERQLRLVVEDLVEDVGRVPDRGGDDIELLTGFLAHAMQRALAASADLLGLG